eukprot:6457280-Amphidinium_carterae.1
MLVLLADLPPQDFVLQYYNTLLHNTNTPIHNALFLRTPLYDATTPICSTTHFVVQTTHLFNQI